MDGAEHGHVAGYRCWRPYPVSTAVAGGREPGRALGIVRGVDAVAVGRSCRSSGSMGRAQAGIFLPGVFDHCLDRYAAARILNDWPRRPASPRGSRGTVCATASLTPRWTPASRCAMFGTPPPTPTIVRPCATTGPPQRQRHATHVVSTLVAGAARWRGPTITPARVPIPGGRHARPDGEECGRLWLLKSLGLPAVVGRRRGLSGARHIA
jgi:hypothetical protein